MQSPGLEGHCRGRRSVSRTTIKVGSDIACRSQAEPCPPPRKHIPLMTINTVLANMSCPREGGKWKESSFLLSTMNVTTEALTRPLRSIPNLQQVGISSSFALSVRGHFTLCGEPLPAKPGTFSWSNVPPRVPRLPCGETLFFLLPSHTARPRRYTHINHLLLFSSVLSTRTSIRDDLMCPVDLTVD
jgi:hypothetical protein